LEVQKPTLDWVVQKVPKKAEGIEIRATIAARVYLPHLRDLSLTDVSAYSVQGTNEPILVRRNGHISRPPLIDHCKSRQKGSSNQDPMLLTAGHKMDASKNTINREAQRRNRDLGQMHIDLNGTMNARNWLPIYDRQIELSGKQAVNGALRCPSVNKCVYSLHAGGWRRTGRTNLKRRIKSNVN
jgi:hypothetical protein